MDRWQSLLGLTVMVGLAWLMSSHRDKVRWRIVFTGLFLQLAFAALILKTPFGVAVFQWIGDQFASVTSCAREGAQFVFGDKLAAAKEPWFFGGPIFAFTVLPTIIFFSSLMSVLYHLGIMQKITYGVAVVMQKVMDTSGAESLSAAANIFLGQTEAPLSVKPYIPGMTRSELAAVMVGGFATVAGGVLAGLVSIGVDAGHLITASVISAPAALLIAKILEPEVSVPQTYGRVAFDPPRDTVNVIHAAAEGATDGMKLAINV
ncbi:MAG: NupC/NupG family nucleoside CNT transporter, partial [Planctomycetia bacterium]